jgi:hypothetical protein
MGPPPTDRPARGPVQTLPKHDEGSGRELAGVIGCDGVCGCVRVSDSASRRAPQKATLAPTLTGPMRPASIRCVFLSMLTCNAAALLLPAVTPAARLLPAVTPTRLATRDASSRPPLPPPPMLPAAIQRQWRRTLGCTACGDSRAVACPNCDGQGGYEAMGGSQVVCRACRGTARVVCRDCFVGDGYDIESIRRRMGYPD